MDANISWRLAGKLKKYFEDCAHVDSIGLDVPSTDIQIWNFALANNFIIVTNDEDFADLSSIKGFPPKIVLLKTGNQSNNFIEQKLIEHKNDIENLISNEDYGLLELF